MQFHCKPLSAGGPGSGFSDGAQSKKQFVYTSSSLVPTILVLQERGDVLTCLVTGNLQPIGWGKMAALGLKVYVSLTKS